MVIKILLFFLLSNLLITLSVAAAETKHSLTSKEVKQTSIDGSTGEAIEKKEGRAVLETKEVGRTVDGKVQSKITREEAVTAERIGPNGERLQENARKKDSTKVEAHVNGDIDVKKETEQSRFGSGE